MEGTQLAPPPLPAKPRTRKFLLVVLGLLALTTGACAWILLQAARVDSDLDFFKAADVEEAWEPLSGSPAACCATELPLRHAELRWLGYPKRILPGGSLPEVFDYADIELEAQWATHCGFLTRYGEVTPLLGKADDRFAVMGHGEEIALAFGAEGLMPLRPGWKRTFFFYSNGNEKGCELHSAASRTVEPLPFRTMRSYPPACESYLLDDDHIQYLTEWNTRPSWLPRRER